MEPISLIFLVVISLVCFRIFYLIHVEVSQKRVAEKIVDTFAPEEWFTIEQCIQRIQYDEWIVNHAITYLYNQEQRLRCRPFGRQDELADDDYARLLAHIHTYGMHPSFVYFLSFSLVPCCKRPKRSLTDLAKKAWEELGPIGKPQPA